MHTFRHWARVLVVMAYLAPVLIAQVADNRPQPAAGATAASAAPDKSDSRRGHRRAGSRHSGVSNPPPALVEKPAATPEPPPAPPALAQLPPTAPQITYRDGMLTVVANNSTLEAILDQVRLKTGASIEYPTSVSQERVVAKVGPAPAPQVLAALLNGSRFDYILLGANGRPDLLQKAIITSKDSGDSVASGAAPPGAVPQPRQATAAKPAAGEEDAESQDDTAEQPEEPPQPQPPQQAQPQPVPQPAPNQPYSVQPGQPQQPPVKTPEQLLQELQRLQQQQQQQPPQPQQQ